MKVDSVRESWNQFRAAVMPPNASNVQIQEMRRAFYAGAWAMFCTMNQASAGSEDEGVEALESLNAEMECFAALLKAGKV